MNDEGLKIIGRKLDIVIHLMLRNSENGGLSLKAQVKLLDELGCRPIEIAGILGRTPKHVSKELAGLRKGRKK